MRCPVVTLAAALLTLAMSGAALAQAPVRGMTMHRVQAGEPDASGWMHAASTEGGFSVRLPLKFNDFTLAESDPQAPVLRTFTVGARSREGIKLTATRIAYRKGAQSARAFFAGFEKRGTARQAGNRRSVDVVQTEGANVSYQRAVLLESDLLLMVVESPRAHDATARDLATRFFDSLVVSR